MAVFGVTRIKKIFEKIDELLFRREDKHLHDFVNSTDTESLVKVLESLPRGRKKMFSHLDPEKASRVIRGLSPYLRQYVLKEINPEKVFAVINFLESDEIADLIKILPHETREAVLSQLRIHDPKRVLELVNLREDTAGGLMKTEMIIGKPQFTVSQFLEYLRATFPSNLPKTHYVYVVDHEGKLMGAVNFNKLFMANRELTLEDLMHPAKHAVSMDEDQEEVAKSFIAQDALELPVLNKGGALVGRISADDIIDVLHTEFSEDIYRLLGAFGNERALDPVTVKVKKRFHWLLINLATAILAAYVVTLFTDTITKFVILAAYMPIIAGMGGNAATQTLGVTIRAIALDQINQLNALKLIFKEILAGMINGFGNGLIMGVIAFFFSHNLELSIVIVIAMTINLFVAGFGGAVIPLIMKSLKIDPALASTVFVTTLTDVAGFASFLGLATLLLK